MSSNGRRRWSTCSSTSVRHMRVRKRAVSWRPEHELNCRGVPAGAHNDVARRSTAAPARQVRVGPNPASRTLSLRADIVSFGDAGRFARWPRRSSPLLATTSTGSPMRRPSRSDTRAWRTRSISVRRTRRSWRRRSSPSSKAPPASVAPPPRRRAGRAVAATTDIASLRAWAAKQKIEVPSRGRIPGAVVEQYKAAGGR